MTWATQLRQAAAASAGYEGAAGSARAWHTDAGIRFDLVVVMSSASSAISIRAPKSRFIAAGNCCALLQLLLLLHCLLLHAHRLCRFRFACGNNNNNSKTKLHNKLKTIEQQAIYIYLSLSFSGTTIYYIYLQIERKPTSNTAATSALTCRQKSKATTTRTTTNKKPETHFQLSRAATGGRGAQARRQHI